MPASFNVDNDDDTDVLVSTVIRDSIYCHPSDTESFVNVENCDEDASAPTYSSDDLFPPLGTLGNDVDDKTPQSILFQHQTSPPKGEDTVQLPSQSQSPTAVSPLDGVSSLIPKTPELASPPAGSQVTKLCSPQREDPVQQHYPFHSPTAVSQLHDLSSWMPNTPEFAIPNSSSQVSKLSSPNGAGIDSQVYAPHSIRPEHQERTHILEDNVQQHSQYEFPTAVSPFDGSGFSFFPVGSAPNSFNSLSPPGDSFGFGSSNPAESEASHSTTQLFPTTPSSQGGDVTRVDVGRRPQSTFRPIDHPSSTLSPEFPSANGSFYLPPVTPSPTAICGPERTDPSTKRKGPQQETKRPKRNRKKTPVKKTYHNGGPKKGPSPKTNRPKRNRRKPPPTKTYYPGGPRPNDIVCQRGAFGNSHHGTILFRDFVKPKHEEYTALPKGSAKTNYSLNIVQYFRERGSRFLQYDKDKHGWFEVTDETAREKVSQLLRDEAKRSRESQEKRAAP